MNELPGLDLDALREHLDAHLPGLARGPLSAEIVQGGRSNLTYLVTDGTDRWVVRRPPLGHVLATAHDMGREHRVMSALAGTGVPVPETLLLCQDDDVIGAPFYVMRYVPGTVYRKPELTQRLSVPERRDLSMRLVDVLADLHSIDPASVGLGDFGRPEGFLERQVRRWSKQLAASHSRDIEGIEELRDRLAASVPDTARAAIVHGDYRLDNVIVGDDLRISAVLDWEMATLGDPFTDLGLLAVYWEGFRGIPENPIAKGVGPEYDFPTARELLDRYAERSGADLSELDWYAGFGYFKIAVILEGIHYRYTRKQTVGEGFDHVGGLVAPLVAQGLAALKEV
ncbi:aminoglycoside phosphotransferase (APT) family kinase protein [Saccharopolyspora erythraea NRRL 2338]|uniref:Phosphotransferase n=2 Tax=Saccharopolyspora erythraea TaxID=1836 RepID=A4FKP2_SACEN|nr:phosphotransferase family protein [Saccharopolyspora erythraea]EQD84509.1 acyl-CoA dehydrogenase [Saccharopolyspora erythraea D]PFG98255.1 aminoglycoside phosphotransferase (APT) family kinase protein [Saccharopolyspora erythraea NRRL 2338]QRK88350.1 phosphotransferase family protein [Saccharopolyspora erythraea]CAM04617.1 putative phosphotransferase [Saccharopolyspora erythraea NRRL 2338]